MKTGTKIVIGVVLGGLLLVGLASILLPTLYRAREFSSRSAVRLGSRYAPSASAGSLPGADDTAKGVGNQIQSGTLTAGSFDDYLNLESYHSFVSSMLSKNPEQRMPDISLGEVVTIHVVDIAGEQELPASGSAGGRLPPGAAAEPPALA